MEPTMPRILVIDDDRDSADMLVEIFRFHRMDARAAYGGVHALAAAQAWLPTVVVMDPCMPGVNGFAVAAALREQLPGAPVIVALTAWPGAMAASGARAAAFHCRLNKPVNVDELLHVVAREAHAQLA